LQTRLRYSGKVRLFGYLIIAFELLTIAVWIAAIIGNGAVLFSIAANSFNKSGGEAVGFVNSTAGETLNVPVAGAGIFSTNVSAQLNILNTQNESVYQQQSSVTVSPGETQNIVMVVPISVLQTGTNGTYYVHISFEVSSLYGLVGTGAKVVVSTCAFNGRCKS
jgi:hypothetical protein